MKRNQLLLGFAMALVLISDMPTASAQQLEKIVIGHSSLRNDIAFLWVPHQLGFFKKNGVDPTIVFISGGVRMIQAIVSESAAMGSTGAALVASAVAGGADTVMILGITNLLTYDIWAKPEVRRPEDLKGKRLAISGFGSSSHVASFLMLKHFGLDEKRDGMTFLVIGDEPTRVQALITGRIDATIVDPSVSGPLKERNFSYLGNLQQLGVPFVNNSVATTKRFIKEHPRVVEAVVKSIIEGNAYMLNPANRPTVTAILAKHLRISQKEADKAYEDLLPKVERKPYPKMDAVKATIQVMGLTNPKIAQLKAEDLVDVSILDRLVQSGFVQ
ncbi:MAG TPA: ABC transporter substrate-binding protein [Candidatus Binatia bacterium]|jgi:ABC-type nitrate/sulfonate/bicarbonate transport system substrate-binding protein